MSGYFLPLLLLIICMHIFLHICLNPVAPLEEFVWLKWQLLFFHNSFSFVINPISTFSTPPFSASNVLALLLLPALSL